ncbi:transposase family protein [Streptomyces sp. ME01-18a]|uniref:transposase family protein n=1 Tax=Streptomyces sp. ME01-18a TaxID=3028669 RepID=UPI0029BD0B03|nr:transposase family protein [Streptomyces sp. ME01-18a]MDX3434223.1 transposase family protein [Streptomyces sp. ME01-18a]
MVGTRRVRRPAVGRKDRGGFFSGKNKQNVVKAMVFTDGDGRLLFCSSTKPGSCADITHARELELVKLLADGPAVEILAGAGYQGLGAQSGGRVVTPPHRKFKKNAPDRYEGMQERRRKAHSSRRIRVEHGIAQWRTGGHWPAISAAEPNWRHRPNHRRPTVPAADRRPILAWQTCHPGSAWHCQGSPLTVPSSLGVVAAPHLKGCDGPRHP